jgi:hypothetical protein
LIPSLKTQYLENWYILALSIAVVEDDLSVKQVMQGRYLKRGEKGRIGETKKINPNIKKEEQVLKT